MKTALSIFIGLMLIFTQHSLAQADELTKAKRDDISKLINMTVSKTIMLQFVGPVYKEMTKRIKPGFKDQEIPKKVFSITRKETVDFFGENLDNFMKKLIPVYAKHYTHPEVKELIEFYKTDLGQLIISKTPKIMFESMMTGQKWAKSLGPALLKKIWKRLSEEGLLPPEKVKEIDK